MSIRAYRGGQTADGWEELFFDRLPYLLGALVGMALMVYLPWLILRRWTWGRWVLITFWALLAFASVSALSNPDFPREDLWTWWMGPVGLFAVLALARYDQRRVKGQPTENGKREQ